MSMMLKAYVMICTLWPDLGILFIIFIHNSIIQLILKIPRITSDVDYDVLRSEISSENALFNL